MRRKQAFKGIVVFLTSIGIASLLGFVLAKTPQMSHDPSPEQIANEWSAEEHLIASNLFEETAARLESKVSHLEQRLARFDQKPYLDPKGFKRQGWKRLMESHQAELSELEEQIAWHQEQANRLNALSVSDEKDTINKGERS